MQSISFTAGRAFLLSDSPTAPWTVLFEDEGVAGYWYACDRSREREEERILDAMLIYNVASLEDAARERLAAVEWSRDGQQAVLYLDGNAQAMFDFEARTGFCRSNFPNFVEGPGDRWHKASHAWNEAALQRFETALYA